MATAYLKSRTGRSLLGEGKAAPMDPTPYLPSPETIERAATELQRLGFNIEAQGVTLSISGAPELFEQACGVKMRTEETNVDESKKHMPQTKSFYKSSQEPMHIREIDDVVEGIVISTPGVPFLDAQIKGLGKY